MPVDRPLKIAVLGGYGLIGSACIRALKRDGHVVLGVGRSERQGKRCDPNIDWIALDIARTSAADWRTALQGVDVVINASGILQDGAGNSLIAIHETAVANLVEALSGTETRFIQISAAGVSETASTAFFRTKANGDQILIKSSLDWVILRPTVVLSPQAYGGTAFLRACSAYPIATPKSLENRPMQTVAVTDVANAVAIAANGDIPSGTIADLTEGESHSIQEMLETIRTWQGFPNWKYCITMPYPLIWLTAKCADALGWLGWRIPLRSTALKVMKDGVTGDASTWEQVGGPPCKNLSETLSDMPATTQDRWFSRLFLMLPVAVAILSVFWVMTGIIALISKEAAIAVLLDHGFSTAMAGAIVVGGAVLDIILGLAILIRRYARLACFGMVILSLEYLIGGSIGAPDLWLDPIGPLLKILPIIGLSLLTAAIIEER